MMNHIIAEHITTIILLVLLGLSLFFFYLKDKKFKKNILNHNKRIKLLLDSQNSLTILTNGKELQEANKAFFDFFGYKTIEDFKKEHKCICDFFELDDSGLYLQKEINGLKWDDYLFKYKNVFHKVKMKDKKFTLHILQVNASLISKEDTATEHVITFHDITELEELNYKLELRVKKKVEQIVDLDKLTSEIANLQSNMLLVLDKNKNRIFINQNFKEFFLVKDLVDFENRYNSMSELFIEHDDYYSNKSNNKCIWIEDIYSLDDDEKVVLLMDIKTLEPKAFIVHIKYIKNTQHWICTFSDFTKIKENYVKIEHKAYIDGLTGVYNRNKFDDIIQLELKKSLRYNHFLSIAIVDIDHFKNFNDTHGHLIGDEVLIMLAQYINTNVRDTDAFARWGGEEFVILFQETSCEDATIVCEKLRDGVEKLNHSKAGKITASFGVTQYKKYDTVFKMFQRCDEALYQAKENGRNRVKYKL